MPEAREIPLRAHARRVPENPRGHWRESLEPGVLIQPDQPGMQPREFCHSRSRPVERCGHFLEVAETCPCGTGDQLPVNPNSAPMKKTRNTTKSWTWLGSLRVLTGVRYLLLASTRTLIGHRIHTWARNLRGNSFDSPLKTGRRAPNCQLRLHLYIRPPQSQADPDSQTPNSKTPAPGFTPHLVRRR